ncbi:MAG: zinc-ribbon domain-containing protein [Pyrinomonadaceae bacterium]
MTITCPQCSARLVIEDGKMPARQFTVRCPKCQQVVEVQPPVPAVEPAGGPITLGDLDVASKTRYQKPVAAPAFKLDKPADAGDAPTAAPPPPAPTPTEGTQDLTRLLTAALQQALAASAVGGKLALGTFDRPGIVADGVPEQRRALVCADPQQRYRIARVLAEGGYEVFVAEDTAQAIERMREDHMHVVVLDANFDPEEKGAAFIRRELSALSPAARRRTFYVHLSADQRTADPHAAFVNHANFVLHPEDIDDLPSLLARTIREFNELYQDFNHVMRAAGI